MSQFIREADQSRGEEFLPVSQHHPVRFRLDVDDVEGLPGGDPQAPALPHGIAFQAAMPAQEAPPGVHEIAGRSQEAPPGLEKILIAAGRDEAQLHALRLVFPDRQSRLAGEAPHLLFGHLPQGEEEVGQQA